MPEPTHIPVLLEEVLAALRPAPGETYADCTAGQGGHAAAVARLLGPTGTVVLNDADPANLADAEARVRAVPDAPQVIALRGNFADLPRRLTDAALAADIVLADLGFASGQVTDPARGFSFQRDGPLDMRLDPAGPTTAADLLAAISERDLADLLRDFGEERHARRIAQKIVRERAVTPITTTAQLASIVRAAVTPSPAVTIDPATRTFQALRIAVNDEMGCLATLLEGVSRAAAQLLHPLATARPGWLRPGARFAVISFHSLEDRQVKQTFTSLVERGLATPAAGEGRRLPKPVVPGDDEQRLNPRSRSARLRAVRLSAGSPTSAG